MDRKRGPYVGVTGFMSHDEVDHATSRIPPDIRHRLMVGVLMSSKTLAGQQNRRPGRFPFRGHVADIFSDHPQVLNLVHYSTDTPETLSVQLERIVQEYGGPLLHGFQLNVSWPDPRQVRWFRARHPEFALVLQIGTKAMAEAGKIERLLRRIDDYGDAVDTILLDPSGGKGQPLDLVRTAYQLGCISTRHPEIGLGIAGGLDAHMLRQIFRAFLEVHPELSIDAEGRLRSEAGDRLSVYAMDQYLQAAWDCL